MYIYPLMIYRDIQLSEKVCGVPRTKELCSHPGMTPLWYWIAALLKVCELLSHNTEALAASLRFVSRLTFKIHLLQTLKKRRISRTAHSPKRRMSLATVIRIGELQQQHKLHHLSC